MLAFGEKPTVIKDKGTKLMEGMLIDQYQQKENLLEYFNAFFYELDLLFEQVEEVYLGRMLEFAVGKQLDVIGVILDQERSVELPTFFFGFQGATGAAGLADEVTPSEGGVFKDENQQDYAITPLDDVTYRRLLAAKAIANTKPTCSSPDAYLLVATLLGKVPRLMHIVTNQSAGVAGAPTGGREVLLQLSSEDTSLADTALVLYFSKYMIPMGTSFNVVRI